MSKPTLRIKFISKQVILLTLFWASITVSKNWAVKAESDEPTDKPPNTGEGENEFESTRKYEGMGYKDRIPRTAAKIRKELIRNEIIPEFFHTPPRYEAFVTYYNATEPDMGNNLRPEQVRFVPDAVTYRYKPESYYCIVMTGLDEPSKAAPTKREFLHWIVGNIIADNLITGEEIAEYYPVLPKKDSGMTGAALIGQVGNFQKNIHLGSRMQSISSTVNILIRHSLRQRRRISQLKCFTPLQYTFERTLCIVSGKNEGKCRKTENLARGLKYFIVKFIGNKWIMICCKAVSVDVKKLSCYFNVVEHHLFW
ncbi:uncharacterized protein [Bemisia tabaci]